MATSWLKMVPRVGGAGPRPGEQPRLAVALPRRDQGEGRERRRELPGCDPEAPGPGADLTERGDREQPTRAQTRDQGRVEARVTEPQAHDEVDGRARRQPVVEVDHAKATPVVDAAAHGEIAARSTATPDTSNPSTRRPRRASHTAAMPGPQAMSSAVPAVGTRCSWAASTRGTATASTGTGSRPA